MNIGGTSSLSESLLNLNKAEQDDRLKRLASGKRINSAADDAAGLQIANRLTTQNNATRQSEQNLYDGLSLANLADQSMQGISDGLNELNRLSVQAGNGLLSAGDRAALQKQADAVTAGIKDQIANTEFAGQKLFTKDGEISVGGGNTKLSVATADLNKQLTDSGAFSVDLSSSDSAANSLSAVQKAAEQIDGQRTTLGATANAISSAARNLGNQDINEQSARSRIADLDYARASTELIQGQIQEQAGLAVATQSRISSQQALQLLG